MTEVTPTEQVNPSADIPENIDVFISYSQRQRDVVSKLADELTERGKVVWRDEKNDNPNQGIALGETIWDAIRNGLNNSDNILFVLSEEAIQSVWCNAELYHSRNKRKFPIILLKDGEEVGDAIERIQHAVNEMEAGQTVPDYIEIEERDVATLAQTNLNDLIGRLLVGVTPENLSTQLEKIIEALDKNADWVRTHKQISNAAFRWEVAQRDPAFLIVGQYLRTINAEVAKHSGKEPFLSELAAEFLEASNQQQQIEEESQQSRLEKAQQDRQRYILLAAIGVIGSVLLTILTGFTVSRLSNNTSELNVLYVTSTANSQAAATQQATATIAAADATAVIDILAEADAVNLELYNALQTAAAADADLGDVLVPTSTITPSPTIDPYVYLDATPQNCPNAPESRLVVDTIATVLGSRQGVQILLRTAPALGATPITSMQIGQEVQVLEGPVCEDQITWWFVEIGDGRQGYIAEGFFIDDELVPDYYLQPIEPITDDN